MYDDIRSFFQAFGTPISAGLAALVAWRFGSIQAAINRQQAETARHKLKFELFEERHRLYMVVADYMEAVSHLGQGDDPPTEQFFRDVRPVRWLFGPEVEHWVFKVLMPEVGRIHGTMLTYRPITGREAMEEVIAMKSSFQTLFHDRDEVFAPYLHLDFDAVKTVEYSLFRART